MVLKPPLAKSAERTITALAFNSMRASQIARFNLPSTGYETRLDRIISARCRPSSLGDGPDVPQGAARPQKLLVRPLREHQPLVNEETCAGEQVQELATRVVWAVPRLSETPEELALRHSKCLPTPLSALQFLSLRDDRSREESSRHCEQLPYRTGHKRPRHEHGCPCACQGLIKWDVDRREGRG